MCTVKGDKSDEGRTNYICYIFQRRSCCVVFFKFPCKLYFAFCSVFSMPVLQLLSERFAEHYGECYIGPSVDFSDLICCKFCHIELFIIPFVALFVARVVLLLAGLLIFLSCSI